MAGRFPAIVKSYDPKKRTCRVEIPAINSGGDVFTEAEISYPIGDKSRIGKWETEIEIFPDDTVWVDFIGGDPRYPVITGYRNPQAGNSVDWRRWHHKNINLNAEKEIIIEAGEKITLKVGGMQLVIDSSGFAFTGGKITHDGVKIDKTHTHDNVKSGADKTGKATA